MDEDAAVALNLLHQFRIYHHYGQHFKNSFLRRQLQPSCFAVAASIVG